MQAHITDPDPVRRAVLAAVEALAQVLGLTTTGAVPDPPAVQRALEDAAAAIAEAQAAHAGPSEANTRRLDPRELPGKARLHNE